jgi:hypothetical protein
VSGARRRRAGIGDRVLVAGVPNVVISVTGSRVRLADEEGAVREVTAAELAADPLFEIAAASRVRRPEFGMEGLPAAVVEEASWWEGHIAEVVYGLRPDARCGGAPETAVRPGAHQPDRSGEGEVGRADSGGPAGPGQHGQAPPPALGGPRPGRARRRPGGPADAARGPC